MVKRIVLLLLISINGYGQTPNPVFFNVHPDSLKVFSALINEFESKPYILDKTGGIKIFNNVYNGSFKINDSDIINETNILLRKIANVFLDSGSTDIFYIGDIVVNNLKLRLIYLDSKSNINYAQFILGFTIKDNKITSILRLCERSYLFAWTDMYFTKIKGNKFIMYTYVSDISIKGKISWYVYAKSKLMDTGYFK